MDPTVLVGIIAAIASLGGSFIGALLNNKVMSYKVEQLEKKANKIDTLENTQISIKGELDSFVQNASERRRMVENLEDEVSKMKTEIQALTTKVALIESEIKLYHNGNHLHNS